MRSYYPDNATYTTATAYHACDISGEVIRPGDDIAFFDIVETEFKPFEGRYVVKHGTAVVKPAALEDAFVQCDDCGDWIRREDVQYYESHHGGTREVCENCLYTNATQCDDCNEWWETDNLTTTAYGDYVCPQCADDNYTRCDQCGQLFRNEETTLIGCESYCDDCAPPLSVELHSYGYKPTPIFFGDDGEALHMGVELEMEADGYDEAEYIVSSLPREIYCKEDGSLSDERGIEAVSHPCTLDYHYILWDEALDICKGNATSHDAGNCGLHVHLSRSYFGDTTAEENFNIAKFVALFDKFYSELLTFSRRPKHNYDHWASANRAEIFYQSDADIAAAFDDIDRYAKNTNARYHAVNLCNDATVEVRIFRGTLVKSTFFAALELCQTFADYAIKHTPKEIRTATWGDVITSGTTRYLVAYAQSRGIADEATGHQVFATAPTTYRAKTPKLFVGDLIRVGGENFFRVVTSSNVDPWTGLILTDYVMAAAPTSSLGHVHERSTNTRQEIDIIAPLPTRAPMFAQ